MKDNHPGDPARRHILRKIIPETLAIFQELLGIPQMRLDKLGEVPDEILRQMVPVMNQGMPSRLQEGQLLVADKRRAGFSPYRQLTAEEQRILQGFDGSSSLDAVSQSLAREFCLQPDEAFRKIKALFIELAGRSLCYPAHTHE